MTDEPELLANILERAMAARRPTHFMQNEPIPPVCETCQGAGYLRYDVPVDDPRFGELIICECTKQELEERRYKLLLERSHLAELGHFTFGSWERKVTTGTPPPTHPDAAYAAASEYAMELAVGGRPWLLLYGGKGLGKTHLAAAIGHARLLLGQPAIFMVVPDLLDHLRATFSPNSEVTYDELFESLRNTPLLILDDMGAHLTSPWAKEKLFQLVNHRYNRRLPTVFTMNEGEELDERLWSRINDHRLSYRCDMSGKDFRQAAGHPPGPPSRSATRRPRVYDHQP